MKLQVHFPGYSIMQVDTDYPDTCNLFEKLTAESAAQELEQAAMGDEADDGLITAQIGGEICMLRRMG